ncbi:UNVERIFIED_ORG: integrase [Peribacillus simplex]
MKHFTSVWGPYPISRITKKMYEERILELNEKYSQNYMDGIHALTQGLIKNNPTEDFKMPKKQQSVEEVEKAEEDIVFLEKEELDLKLSYTDGLEMDHFVFTVLSYTGLRIGELLALKWGGF